MRSYRKLVCAVLVPAVVVLYMPKPAAAAVLPYDADRTAAQDLARVPPAPGSVLVPEAGASLRLAAFSEPGIALRSQALDRTEMAQLAKTDLRQKGKDGGAVIILAAVGALALLIWLVRGIGASDVDDDDHDHDHGHSHGTGDTDVKIETEDD
jgi:hypothetical protein